jgi:hypothetical protein
MAATDQQMQTFANERIRPRAEQFRALDLACADDKAALDDEYARAQAGPLWSDARADGPPHLLASGPGSSPDDLTNYNALLDLWRKFRTGTFVSRGRGEQRGGPVHGPDAGVRPAGRGVMIVALGEHLLGS